MMLVPVLINELNCTLYWITPSRTPTYLLQNSNLYEYLCLSHYAGKEPSRRSVWAPPHPMVLAVEIVAIL